MNRFVFILLCSFFIFSWGAATAETSPGNTIGEREPAITLTPEEQAWLQANPDIRLGSDTNWQPYVWRDADGSIKGIEADLIARINALTGANIRLELGNWNEMVEKAQRGKLYGLAVSARQPEREAQFLFTNSPYSTYKYIFIRNDRQFSTMQDLFGHKIGVLRGNLAEAKLLQRWPQLVPVESDSPIEMAADLQRGKIDAAISSGNFYWAVREQMLPDIRMAFPVPDSKIDLLYSINKQYPQLHSIINKALAAIQPGEILNILGKWGAQQPPPGKVILNTAEQAYLEKTELRLGEISDWMPLTFLNKDDQTIGIVEDYWALIREKLNLKETSRKTAPTAELLQAMRNGEIDIIPGTTSSTDSASYAVFSDSYEQYPIAIATRRKAGFISDASVLMGKTVAVDNNHNIYTLLKDHYPAINFIQVKNTHEALARVAAGKAYAAMGILPVIQFQIDHYSIENIQLAGVTDVQFPLQIMLDKQHASLMPLLNRAIAAITEEERTAIHRKWMLRELVSTPDYTLLWQVLGFATLILASMLYWNHKLRREILGRKQAKLLLQKSEAELLRAKEEADAANAAKSRFLTNMSHEIRTPINAMIGMGHLMRHTLLSTQQADYLDKMQSSSRLLLGIIDDILDLSKIEAGKLKLTSVAFSPSEILQQVSALLGEQARQKGLEFHADIHSDVPKCLMGDPQRLTQILLNLAGNAIKFTTKGNVHIGISLPDKSEDKNRLTFIVKDTGPGISAEQQQKLFQPFFQVDSSLTRRHGGSGLGLVISQSLAHLMGGGITVDSQPGQGSTFTLLVNLPVCTEDLPTRIPKPPQPAVSPTVRVLLVEDDVLNQMITVELLSRMGASVTLANNGKEAIEVLRKASFNLAFMDLQMPEMDGYEAVRLIRQQREWEHLPIVTLTAHANTDEREKCLKAGMNDYLSKPFEPAQLAQMLSKWTETKARE